MWSHYLLTLYRSLTRHRLYAALNVLGLAVGVAVFLVLWLDVRFETGFDRWIPQADNTYRLDEVLTRPGLSPRQSAKTTSVIAPLLKADYPQVAAYTRLIWDDQPLSRGLTSGTEDVRYVDQDFFKVLALPLERGDGSTALSSPGDVVITQAIARKYFGTTDVLGRRLTLTERDAKTSVRVSGVLRDLPRDTHLKLGVLKALTPAYEQHDSSFTDWNSQTGSTYLRFRNRADAQAVQADLVNFVERRARGSGETKLGDHPTKLLSLRLTPLPAIHFETAITTADFQPNVDARVVASLALVGVLTLGIAVLNYVNLATAQSALRAREVAVRKVMGATSRALVVQFLAEAVVMSFAAGLIGLAMTELLLPLVNAAGGSALSLAYWGPRGVVPVLLAAVLVIGFAAGAYPALLLSSFQPARVLAASRMPGGGKLDARIRGALVVVQFAAAIAFTISTLVMSEQAKYLQAADRGFKREGLIVVDSLSAHSLLSRQSVILDALRKVPGVSFVSSSSREPASQSIDMVPVKVTGHTDPDQNMVLEAVSPDYFQTYGAEVIAGRAFDTSHQIDDASAVMDEDVPSKRGLNVMLNQAAVKNLGFSSPADAIGRSITAIGDPASVIGVARDVRFMSPHDPVQPVIYLYRANVVYGGIGAVRYQGVDPRSMMASLAAVWREVGEGEPFVASSADVRLSDYYVPDQQRARLFTMGSVLAVAIGCVGLYGLASFNTARRVREIGIRKTLGASTADILRLLVGQFLRPVALANLLAWPLAFFAMRSWLSSFDQRISLSPLYFLAATLLTLAVALTTVVGQVLVVARAEPAKALRHD